MKNEVFDELINEMSKCSKCISLKKKTGKDCSLINIYQIHGFCKNVPSIWTDWFNRLDSKIMIIGQDWGPYNDMKQLNEQYINNPDRENWKYLIEQEKSNTKKLLNYYIRESSENRYSLDDIFITNAIMCARKGNNYRGDNIDLKKSTNNCSKYLLSQINIVKPRVILTLGYYPLLSLSKIYKFNIYYKYNPKYANLSTIFYIQLNKYQFRNVPIIFSLSGEFIKASFKSLIIFW